MHRYQEDENTFKYMVILTNLFSLLVIGYLLWTLTNFGFLYEGAKSAWPVELFR